MQMGLDILLLVTKVTRYFCFSQGVNSIRGHASLLLVLRKCFRGGETKKNDLKRLFWSCCMQNSEIFLFFGYKGQFDTLVFHNGVNSIRADKSSPLVPTSLLS